MTLFLSLEREEVHWSATARDRDGWRHCCCSLRQIDDQRKGSKDELSAEMTDGLLVTPRSHFRCTMVKREWLGGHVGWSEDTELDMNTISKQLKIRDCSLGEKAALCGHRRTTHKAGLRVSSIRETTTESFKKSGRASSWKILPKSAGSRRS